MTETNETDVAEIEAPKRELDQKVMKKLMFDLHDVEIELNKHGSSVRAMLANVAKHSMGVSVAVTTPVEPAAK